MTYDSITHSIVIGHLVSCLPSQLYELYLSYSAPQHSGFSISI